MSDNSAHRYLATVTYPRTNDRTTMDNSVCIYNYRSYGVIRAVSRRVHRHPWLSRPESFTLLSYSYTGRERAKKVHSLSSATGYHLIRFHDRALGYKVAGICGDFSAINVVRVCLNNGLPDLMECGTRESEKLERRGGDLLIFKMALNKCQ